MTEDENVNKPLPKEDIPTLDSSKDEKEDYQSQGSPPPAMAMPPKPRDPQVPPPASRPPSTSSLQSTASIGAPARTTTSRRGGRQRSRSPPAMINRSGSANAPDREFSDDGRNQTQSPANPSSAAAAAAAAAQALSSSNTNRNPQWFDGGSEGPSQRERRTEGSRYPPLYDNRYPGTRRWPGEDDSDSRRNYYRSVRPREGESDNRQYSTRGSYPSDRLGSGNQHDGYPGSSRHSYDRHGGAYDSSLDQEGRYQDPRSASFERGGDRSSHHESDRHHLRYSREPDPNGEFFRGPAMSINAGEAYSPKTLGQRETASTPSTVKRSGGTSRVIGTATPIHVPRAADAPNSNRHLAPAGTPASVFRGRPGEDMAGRTGAPEDDSPQKILLSLRTPDASFEEQQGQPKSRKMGGQVGPPLSPEEPPQIQHSHHQHQMDQALFFDQPNRGGSPKTLSTGPIVGLDMAPSFSLFNQSFDSLGDTAQYLNVSEPLEGAFNSSSFGAGPSGSRDNNEVSHLLPNPSQAGSFAAGDRFLGSSSGGNFTFGMSPVNSFGNGPANNSSRRSGNMMVLGGPDQHPTSPTQMLSMYPSYSGGYGSQGSGQHIPFRTRSGQVPDQNAMRTMSSGSFGGGATMYNSRSYDASPHAGYHASHNPDGQRLHDGPPNFYAFLDRNKSAFVKCSFLLPGLKAALLESPISDAKKVGEIDQSGRKLTLGGRRGRYAEPCPQDTAIAMRRIASAICAFGGTITGDRGNTVEGKSKDIKTSIFREKDDEVKAETVAVTPSSSAGTPPGSRATQSRANHKYDELLPSRYYENENRLSWEFEETPPVGSDDDPDDTQSQMNEGAPKTKTEDDDDNSRNGSSPTPSEDDRKPSSSPTNEDGSKAGGPEGDQPKMRYRCKLCGLPKQNHTCAYQQSLQRSIGIMVYPAVNAFTSGEPGLLAPNLTDMNNFVITQPGDASSTEESPSRPTPDRSRRLGQTSTPGMGAPNVTPETMRSSNSSSSSGNSGGLRTPLRSPNSTTRKPRGSNLSGGAAMGQRVGTGSPPGSESRKRTHAQLSSGGDEDLLFVETVDLKPEQFRIVTPSKKAPLDAYTYPSLPLPYAQRKRLSDNLFALSKEVPQLTDECAIVLREARERDMWDLAVAELMTQVVVIIHCNGNDCRFEGLRHYLLTLGIAC